MAPAGGFTRKLVLPACQHAPNAKAYLTSHLCWQDRVATERGRDFATWDSPSRAPKPPKKSKSFTALTALELARHEYHPIGGSTCKNNNSGQISCTLGCGSWHGSGGLKTEYGSQVGKAGLPMFGSPPQAEDMSATYAIRAEGRRKGRADQMEAMQQHGEGTILNLYRGDALPGNPVEAQVFRGGGIASLPPQSGGQARALSTGASVRSRYSDESFGSVMSGIDELRRINELGGKARAIARHGASAVQMDPLQQHGQGTIIGMRQGLIPTGNPVEERLLHQGSSDNRRRRTPAA